MIEFTLPSLGSEMDDGTVLEWKVGVGDRVERGQVVAVVDTSKAAIDVECWHEGTVHEIRARVGEKIPVGAVMATLLEPGEQPAAAPLRSSDPGRHETADVGAPSQAPAPRTPTAPTPAAARTGTRGRVTPAARRRARALGIEPDGLRGSGPGGAVTLADIEGMESVQAPANPPAVSPAARRHARERGVDIAAVTGSGPRGAITVTDVERAAASAARAPGVGPARAGERAAAMRKSIAAAMARSKREIPHYYLGETVPMARALAWLAQVNADRPITERLLAVILQLKAVALALRKYPELNGFFRDGVFEPSPGVHLGVAIGLRQGGLVAPALHDADAKSAPQLMREVTDLVRRARAGSLRSSEMSDPTVTVTNLGDQGVETVFGVIYPPQVALVGFGRISERPWAEHGGLKVLAQVNVSLAADHRVSDGHRGALFLAEVRELLQQPQALA